RQVYLGRKALEALDRKLRVDLTQGADCRRLIADPMAHAALIRRVLPSAVLGILGKICPCHDDQDHDDGAEDASASAAHEEEHAAKARAAVISSAAVSSAAIAGSS